MTTLKRLLAFRLLRRLGLSEDRGTAMVEMAVVLPVLLLMMTGMCTLGITCNSYLELTDAVSIGARQLAVSRGATTDPCSMTANIIASAAPFLTASKMTVSMVLDTTSYGPFTGTSAASCSGASTTSGPPANLVQGHPVTVKVTYPCTVAVFGNANIAPGCTLTAQISELEQ